MSRAPGHKNLKYEVVNPSDFNKLDTTYCCEQCSHFNPQTTRCGLNISNEVFKNDYQLKQYELSGRMAFCRMMELD